MQEVGLETLEASLIEHTSTAPDVSSARARFEAELKHAEELKTAIEQSSHAQLGQFDVFRDAVEALMQQSWFDPNEQLALQQRLAALYQTALHWKTIYEHLHYADQRRELLMTEEEPGRTPLVDLEHQVWTELQEHVAALAAHEAFFTPDTQIRHLQLRHTVEVWNVIYAALHYGEEAMAVLRERFSPEDIRKLRSQVLTLEEDLPFSTHPLQRRRADALREFCVHRIRRVFGHDTFFSPTHDSPNVLAGF